MNNRVAINTLFAKLSKLNFSSWSSITEEDIINGNPELYCHFLRFIFLSYPKGTLVITQKYPWFVLEVSDSRFAFLILKLLRSENGHTTLTPFQFQQEKFASAKSEICLEVIKILSQASAEMPKRNEVKRIVAASSKSKNQIINSAKHKISQRASQLGSLPRTM